MRISSATVTLASVSLTGEAGLTGLLISGQGSPDVVPLSGAAGVEVYDRGNSSMSISFTAVREFATEAALEQFVISHFGTLVKGGALAFTVSGVTKTASTAAVQSVSFGEPFGMLLPVTYQIVSSPLL